jgi:hypothetical protein
MLSLFQEKESSQPASGASMSKWITAEWGKRAPCSRSFIPCSSDISRLHFIPSLAKCWHCRINDYNHTKTQQEWTVGAGQWEAGLRTSTQYASGPFVPLFFPRPRTSASERSHIVESVILLSTLLGPAQHIIRLIIGTTSI